MEEKKDLIKKRRRIIEGESGEKKGKRKSNEGRRRS
jgi:hypothetical protein